MKLPGLALVVLVAATSACSTYQGKINTHLDPGYRQGTIKRLAVFTIRNASRAPYKSRRVNAEISRAIEGKNPAVQVVSPPGALRKSNESEWAHVVNDYHTSGVANLGALGRVSKNLNVDAVLQGQLVGIRQRHATALVAGETRVTLSFSVIETVSGKQVWYVSADGVCTTQTPGAPPPIPDAIEDAMRKILGNIPRL